VKLAIWLAMFLLSACGGGGSSAPSPQLQAAAPSPAPAVAPVSGQNLVSQSIDGQLIDRTFQIRAPADQTEDSYPVVFFFYGAGGYGEGLLNAHPEIGDLIDSGEFIGIFPDGYQQQWNVSGENSADDVAFVSLIVNILEADSKFNLDRIYGVGISNGAGLVNKIAKESAVFKGIAPLISQQTVTIGGLVPAQAVSVFQVNGANDELVPLDGGAGVANSNFMSAQASAANWASSFNCDMTTSSRAQTWGEQTVEELTFTGCLNNKKVRYFIVEDGEHSIDLKVIAKTGWTTSDLLGAIEAEDPATDFDLVTLLIGVNNQFQSRPFEVYETEFIELVDKAISFVGGDPSKLIVMSIPDYAFTPFGEFRNPSRISAGIDLYNNYAQDYCEDNGLSYVYIIDITREGLDNPSLVASDNLHPSTQAYSGFVERLLPLALTKLEQRLASQ